MKTNVLSKIRFIAVIVACIVIMYCLLNLALGFSTADSYTIVEYKTITVHSGDTLWNLALKYMPSDMEIHEAIYRLEELNNVNAATLYAGMTIQVPIYG